MPIFVIFAILSFLFVVGIPARCQTQINALKITLALSKKECKLGNIILAKLTITNLGKEEIWIPKYGIYGKTSYYIEKLFQIDDQKRNTGPVAVGRNNYYPGRVFELIGEGGKPSKSKGDYILLGSKQSYSGDSFNLLTGAEGILKPGDWKVWIENYYACDKILMPDGFCGWLRSNPVNFSMEK